MVFSTIIAKSFSSLPLFIITFPKLKLIHCHHHILLFGMIFQEFHGTNNSGHFSPTIYGCHQFTGQPIALASNHNAHHTLLIAHFPKLITFHTTALILSNCFVTRQTMLQTISNIVSFTLFHTLLVVSCILSRFLKTAIATSLIPPVTTPSRTLAIVFATPIICSEFLLHRSFILVHTPIQNAFISSKFLYIYKASPHNNHISSPIGHHIARNTIFIAAKPLIITGNANHNVPMTVIIQAIAPDNGISMPISQAFSLAQSLAFSINGIIFSASPVNIGAIFSPNTSHKSHRAFFIAWMPHSVVSLIAAFSPP